MGLNSTDGTFVNGKRVTRCLLQPSDVIRAGRAESVFHPRGRPGRGRRDRARSSLQENATREEVEGRAIRAQVRRKW